jgi:hypothetical protein
MKSLKFEALLSDAFPITTLLEELESLRLKGWRLPKGHYAVVLYCDEVTARVYALTANDIGEALNGASEQHSNRGEALMVGSSAFVWALCPELSCPCFGEMAVAAVALASTVPGDYQGQNYIN